MTTDPPADEIEPMVPPLPSAVRTDGGRRQSRPAPDEELDAPLVPDLS